MSGAEDGAQAFDEFDFIAEVLRPLTGGAPEALDLLDDAAVIPSRPGWDLVVTADTLVEGVHFLSEDLPELVARKLLRVNLSDLAAKAAEPYGYFLTTCWPRGYPLDARRAFAAGLAVDGSAFGLKLFGGDTTSTFGPLTVGAALMGWAPSGGTVRRAGAKAGDLVLVSGAIGDGWLGLAAAQGRLDELGPEAMTDLARRYRLPEPRLGLRRLLRTHASAAADISDGLVADAGHIARASGVKLELDLHRLPLSPAARSWLTRQPQDVQAMAQLATGGDDYEIVCTAPPRAAEALVALTIDTAAALSVIGRVVQGQGVEAHWQGEPVALAHTGWRHG